MVLAPILMLYLNIYLYQSGLSSYNKDIQFFHLEGLHKKLDEFKKNYSKQLKR